MGNIPTVTLMTWIACAVEFFCKKVFIYVYSIISKAGHKNIMSIHDVAERKRSGVR